MARKNRENQEERAIQTEEFNEEEAGEAYRNAVEEAAEDEDGAPIRDC